MIRPTHILQHKDGTKQLVRVIGQENNYWMDKVEKAMNRNKANLVGYPTKNGKTTFERICILVESYLYSALPVGDKSVYVEPIDNVPFDYTKCFYTKNKFIKKLNWISLFKIKVNDFLISM